MKCDQIAYYCSTDEEIDELRTDLKLDKDACIIDKATGRSRIVRGNKVIECVNVAKLIFNYQLGIELEMIRYMSGDHWHPRPVERKAISHIGIHLEDDEEFPLMPYSTLVQETKTISHTSDYLSNPKSPGFGRTYHYRIHQLGPGNYVKFIKRIHPRHLASGSANV